MVQGEKSIERIAEVVGVDQSGAGWSVVEYNNKYRTIILKSSGNSRAYKAEGARM